MNSQLLCGQGVQFLQRGNLVAAERVFMEIIATDPSNVMANQMLGVLRTQQGRYADALDFMSVALRGNPRSASVLSNCGNVYRALGRFEEALKYYDRAIDVEPNGAMLHCNRGGTLVALGRFEQAVASFDRAIKIQPKYAEAEHGKGLALWNMRNFAEACASYNRALQLKPNFVDALYNRGLVLEAMERFEEAVKSYDQALALKSDFSEAWTNRGNALRSLKRFDEALISYERLLKANPNSAEGLNNRGIALWNLNRFEDALSSFTAALAFNSDYSDALNNRGVCFASLKRFEEALSDFNKALSINPDSADALYNRGDVLRALKRFEEAYANYDRVLNIVPDHTYALGGAAHALLNVCGWQRTGEITSNIVTHVRKAVMPPFTLLGYCDDPQLQLECAITYVRDKFPAKQVPLRAKRQSQHDKIRIAYLSADFQEHATAFLTAELFELHDRSRFEVLALSYGSDDGSDMRRRLVAAFDEFHDVSNKSDYEVALMLHEQGVDIAIDLKGHTQDGRLGIFQYRPCPVQITYLGYPGTLGADFIDYVIADQVVAPFDQQPFFVERIVHLPDSYQVNDSKRRIAETIPTRSEVGLPEKGVVFCCFNNSWKISSTIFDVWMRLLDGVPDSVLWLIEDNNGASSRLRTEALSHGIDPSRLIFASRLALPEHLARHGLADLFLDTLPYNAHTTASDALWVGVPIITCLGNCFAGRVAASLLHAIGMPHLITKTIDEYERLALKIANNPELLRHLKVELAQKRSTYPLFDARRFCRNIEVAYTTMIDVANRGERPRSFRVEISAL
jgi:protein O-GlcNAc transferase